MERITLPAPEPLVVRLPAPVEEVLRLPAVETLTLQLPTPAENVLTLPTPEPLQIVLPASMIPQAPRLTAGGVAGEATISGVATEAARAIARASGTLSGAASITGAAKARAVATGGITGAGTLSGVAGARAVGTLTGTGSLAGKAIAKLAGVVAGAASIVGAVKTLLSGGVTSSGTVSGTAAAKAVASGTITGAASITGTAIQMLVAPSRVNKNGNQIISSAWGTVTGWTLAPGYQGAATTNGLLIIGSGTVDITAQVRSPIGHYQYLRIMRNGVQVGPEGSANAISVSTSATGIAVNDGDVISLTWNGLGTGDIYKTVNGGTDTYIQITAA